MDENMEPQMASNNYTSPMWRSWRNVSVHSLNLALSKAIVSKECVSDALTPYDLGTKQRRFEYTHEGIDCLCKVRSVGFGEVSLYTYVGLKSVMKCPINPDHIHHVRSAAYVTTRLERDKGFYIHNVGPLRMVCWGARKILNEVREWDFEPMGYGVGDPNLR